MPSFDLEESYKPERTTVEASGIESITLGIEIRSELEIMISSIPYLSYVAIVVAPTAKLGKSRSYSLILCPNLLAVTDNFVTTSATSALGIFGAVATASATGANPWRGAGSATFSDYMVSGTNFYQGTASNSDTAVTFASISASSGGAVSQAAAITNRTGWL